MTFVKVSIHKEVQKARGLTSWGTITQLMLLLRDNLMKCYLMLQNFDSQLVTTKSPRLETTICRMLLVCLCQMARPMKEQLIIKQSASTVMEHRYGKMVRSTSENGWTGKQKVKELFTTRTVICSKANLNKTKQTDLELTNIKVDKLTLEAGSMTFKKDKAPRRFKTEVYTRENSIMV